MAKKVKPLIFGIEGTKLNDQEKYFFEKHNPYGFILFQRNCDNPEQVYNLNQQLKNCCENPDIHILIDQEGGRVARLKEPNFREFPAAKFFGDISNLEKACQKVYNNAKDMGLYLAELGFTINCAPMADISYNYANQIVMGDRCYSEDKRIVIELAKNFAEGLLAANIYPIIKHIPGHGRAKVDSHFELPYIENSYTELLENDFLVFKKLNHLPYAMTGHLLFSKIDKYKPVTFSKKIIEIIRNDIGFKGTLISDDLSMKALSGSYQERAKKSLEAGCDILLHCNANSQEMQEIAEAIL